MDKLQHVVSQPVVDFGTKVTAPRHNAKDLWTIASRTAIAAAALYAVSQGYGVWLTLGATAALSFPATVMAIGAAIAFKGATIGIAAVKAHAAMALFKGAAIYLAGVFIINLHNADWLGYRQIFYLAPNLVVDIKDGLLETGEVRIPVNVRYSEWRLFSSSQDYYLDCTGFSAGRVDVEDEDE